MTHPLNLSPVLATNLRSLARANGGLASRLCLPVVMDHLDDEVTRLRIHRTQHELRIPEADVAELTAQACGVVRIMGIGLGEMVDACLQRGCTVLAWDRDPALVRAALSGFDWSEAIALGRLQLSLGVDLIELRKRAVDTTLLHPLLGQVYQQDCILLDTPFMDRRVLVCAGGLFVHDICEALRESGYAVYLWDIHRLSEQELDHVVERFDPAFVVAINHIHGLAEACYRLNRELIVWEIDPATDSLRRCGTPTEHVRFFSYRQANVARLRAVGFRHVEPLALAANVHRRVPPAIDSEPDPDAQGAVCFVGSSMVGQAQRFREQFLEAWVRVAGGDPVHRANGHSLLESILAEQGRYAPAYVIPELMLQQMRGFVSAARKFMQHDPVALVGEIAAAEWRLNVVSGLACTGVEVWGDPGWKEVAVDGLNYHGYAGHDRALTRIYQSGAVHIDIGRIYQRDIVTMRVFDILACGGFLIAEHGDALTELFRPGTHLETWRTIEELQDKVRHYLAHPEAAQRMAAEGMAHVRTHHTITQRVHHMLKQLNGAQVSNRFVV